MNKNEFLDKIEGLLADIPHDEREDILYDYEEYFRMGLEEGKAEEEITESLGDPILLAKEFKAGYMVNRAEETATTNNVGIGVLATVSLGAFNLIFVLGPFIGVVGVSIGFFAASIGITLAGIAMVVSSIIGQVGWIHLPSSLYVNAISTFFIGIGFTSMGLLFTIGVCYLGKLFYHLTVKYLKFNLKLITDRRAKNEIKY
ncbi:HAAS signaling domain-containing protein [Alkaliphilus transvaalensis]|uniref:HAAS signaling domain-containing protein n=1 Tax=Alkaliphilus transvaalensis TaxID=114628 RepID=UPI00047AB7C6|nr:DUF1700 domain-containing protein [Alkaliphilus transvaalensis]